MSRIVVALGGNALGNSPTSQLEIVKETAKPLVDLISDGHEVIIVHGNGPQVGMINLAMSEVEMPFPECGAMSQGYIGYHLQNAIQHELKTREINKTCACIVTQVLVDHNDEAFKNPTKPIGKFYTEEEAKKIADSKNVVFKEDAGRGYREVVASPKPKKIIEENVIQAVLDSGNVVICCGGGGIPVIEQAGLLQGVNAVIDKDFASELVAERFNADYLFILTAVERVAINFGKENQEDLESLTIERAEKLIAEGQFAPGSMLPKVEACLKFANKNPNNVAIIASLEKAKLALKGESGTKITQ